MNHHIHLQPRVNLQLKLQKCLLASSLNQIPSSRIFIRIFGQQEIRQPNIRLEHTFTYTKENNALSLVSIWTFCALRCSSWFFLARFGFSSSDVRCCFLLLFVAFCCFSLLFVARRCSFWLFIALDINHLPLVQNWCE